MEIKFITLEELEEVHPPAPNTSIPLCSLLDAREYLGGKILCDSCHTCPIGHSSYLHLKDFSSMQELYDRGKEELVLLRALL